MLARIGMQLMDILGDNNIRANAEPAVDKPPRRQILTLAQIAIQAAAEVVNIFSVRLLLRFPNETFVMAVSRIQ
ncbi:hypothetical protein D9619_013690 [Psilocybe cf. subviscida]|uniref:Uncharacterized protein n=1 Tax=Psilocybe cf. subviscida TaxID=2480587 RepID=A0A8H5EVP3_9AGAR|nr:hypothetical protein D9619_013690 [Psilocybe cf. subviscida]